MKYCLQEGELRARLDGELPEAQLAAVDQHLAGCPACSAAYGEIAARASRVSEWMESLSADIPAPVVAARRRVSRPAVWAGVAGLAAALLVAIVLSRRPGPAPVKAVVNSPAPPAPSTVLAEVPPSAVSVPERLPKPPVRRAAARATRPPQVQYYVALDEEPIDTGLVMRVALPSGMQADVIVDGDGRARAIRPVSHTKEPQ